MSVSRSEAAETLRNLAIRIERGDAEPYSIEHVSVRGQQTTAAPSRKSINYIRVVIRLLNGVPS